MLASTRAAPRPRRLRQEPPEEVVERAERADPAAEDATEDHREGEEAHAPEQPPVHGVGREGRHRPDERIGEQERLDRERQPHRRVRPCSEAAAEPRLEEEVHEQAEEEDLRGAARPLEDDGDAARGDAGAGELGGFSWGGGVRSRLGSRLGSRSRSRSGFRVGVAVPTSSGGTIPTLPVFHGIGSTSGCSCGSPSGSGASFTPAWAMA